MPLWVKVSSVMFKGKQLSMFLNVKTMQVCLHVSAQLLQIHTHNITADHFPKHTIPMFPPSCQLLFVLSFIKF